MAPHRFADLAAHVLAGPPRLGSVRLVGVDGPTGSGKSTFAERLVPALVSLADGGPVTLLHTDDLLAGWTDTVTFWSRLEAWVLGPLRDHRPGAYRRYDWSAGRFDDEWVEVPAAGVLVLDGVTSTRRVVRDELTLSVWMSLPFERSLARAIERDGPGARRDLKAWHERELAHFDVDAAAASADVVVDGDPAVPPRPAEEFVAVTWR